MKTKPTPGPWKLEKIPHSSGTYFYVIGYPRLNNEIKNEADANLIAAAPELLEALEELMAVQNGPPLITYTKDWEKAMDMAEKAIAKAEGK